MKTETGMRARMHRGLKRFFSNSAICCLVLVSFPLSAAGFFGGEDFGEFRENDAWRMEYAARQPDDAWSEPKIIEFKVDSISPDRVFLEISFPGCPPSAHLELGRNPGCLRAIELFQWIRGKQRVKREVFEHPAPVFSMFSVLPYFVPVFTAAPGPQEYLLSREVNGVPMIAETLTQKIEPIDRQSLINAFSSSSPPPAWLSMVPNDTGLRVAVVKDGELVFTQYWFPGLPWAVYTESENIRAWLVK